MKKRISIAVSVVALALLLIAGTVAVTVAYLTSTETVTNTFTVGKVAITLKESKLNADGTTVDTSVKVNANTYHLLPGKTYAKDPVVTVVAKSENCYVFIKVVNQIAGVEVAAEDGNTIAEQLEANGWKAVAGETGVYVYNGANATNNIVAKRDADLPLKVIDTVTIKDDATNENLTAVAGNTVVITAYAIQSEGLADVAAAWKAVKDIQP